MSESTENGTNEPLHISIANELADDILSGAWKPGTSKRLDEIQDQFGISRTVAREATRLLSSIRCVQLQRGTGVIACKPDEWDDLSTRVITWKLHSSLREQELRTLTELRLCVEPAAAAGCASRGSVENRARIAALGHELIKAARENRLADFHNLDVQFHTLLLTSSGNPLFAELKTVVEAVIRGRVEIDMYPPQPEEEALHAHERVAQAVLKGDSAAARDAMHDIVAEVNSALDLSTL